jgi:hypothetical protein
MTDNEANKKLNQLLLKADGLFDKRYSIAENNIIDGYKRSLEEIKAKLSKMFEDYNGKPTITELRKFKRLDTLEKQITEIIAQMEHFQLNIISSNVKGSLTQSYALTGAAFNTATGLDFAFNMIPKESIDFVLRYNRWPDTIKNNNAQLLTNILSENEKYLRANASREVAGGLAQGKSYAKVIKSISERFDITRDRATRITYDQMHSGAMAGRNEGIKSASAAAERLGLEFEKIWVHNGGRKVPRPDHVLMGKEGYKGHVADKNGIFTLPDGTKTEAPGLTGLPNHDIACNCSALFSIKGLD